MPVGSSLNLPPTSGGGFLTVPSFSDLPDPVTSGVGAAYVTADTGVLYISDGTAWNATAGGGSVVGGTNIGGGVVRWFKNIVGGNLAFRSLQSSDGTITYALGDTIDASVDIATVVSTANIATALGLPANTFLFSDPSSNIVGYNNWQIDPTDNTANIGSRIQPNNIPQYYNGYNWNVNVEPLQNSPNDSMSVQNFTVNLDNAATGFQFGTGGQAATIISGGHNYGGNGASFGEMRSINLFSGFGNGTDPGTVKGLQASALSYRFSANMTVDGQCGGYDFNINLDSSAITTSNFNILWGSDFSQLPVDVYGYQFLTSQPNIMKIKNGHNFNAYTSFPTIGTMEGNAGFYAYSVGGSVGTLGTSGYQAYGSNTNVTTMVAGSNFNPFNNYSQIGTIPATSGYTGHAISPVITLLNGSFSGYQSYPQIAGGSGNASLFQGSMGSVTTTGQTYITQINGQTANGKQSRLDIDGIQTNLSGTCVPLSNQGTQIQHLLFTDFQMNGVGTVTGTDVLMNTLSPQVDFGTVSDYVQKGPFGLGTAMVAFAGQLAGHGRMDLLSALTPTAIFQSDMTLDEWRNVNAYILNGGYTGACAKATAFYHEVAGAGLFATTHWGLKVVTAGIENYVPRMMVGGGGVMKVPNSSVALGVAGAAFLAPALDNAGEAALVALNGMIIYNNQTNKFRCYENGAWRNL